MADSIVIGKLRAILGMDTAQYEAGARKSSAINKSLAAEMKRSQEEIKKFALTGDATFKNMVVGMSAAGKQASASAVLIRGMGQAGKQAAEQMAAASASMQQSLQRVSAVQQATARSSAAAWAAARRVDADRSTAAQAMHAQAIASAASTQTLSQRISAMAGPLKSMAVGMGAAFSVGTVVNFAREIGRFSERIIDLSAETGIGTQRLQAFNYIAAQSGLTVEDVTTSVTQLQRRLAGGDESAAAAVERLGLVVGELIDGSPDEAFIAIAEAVARIPEEAQRTAIMFELMGRTGSRMLRLVTEDFGKFVEEVETKGPIIEKATLESAEKFKQFWDNAFIHAMAGAANFFAAITDPRVWTLQQPKGLFGDIALDPAKAGGAPGVVHGTGLPERNRAAENAAEEAIRRRQQLAEEAARAHQEAQDRAHRSAIERLKEFDVAGEKLMADIAKDYQDRLEVMGQMTEDAERLTRVLDDLTQREQGAHLERVNQETLRSVKSIAEARKTAARDAQAAEFETAEFAIDQAARQGASWKTLYAMERDLRADRLQAAIADSRAQFEAEASVIDQSTTLGLMEFNALEDAHRASVERMVAEARRGEEQKRADMAITTGAMAAQFIGATDYALQLFATVDKHSKLLGSLAKAGAISQAIMNTYVAATKALAQGGIFGFATMASVIAAGLAQVAIIKKTPVGYREGTRDLDFQDFGSRTRTELHGQEAVIPRGGGHRLASEIAMSLRTQFAAPSVMQGFTMPGAARPAVIGGAMTSGLRMSGQAGGVTHVYNTVTIQAWDASDMQRAVDTQLIPRLNVASQRNTGHYATEHRKGFGIRPPYGAR